MDAAERDLFEGAVRRAMAGGSPVEVNAALDELGWSDALFDDRPTAVSVLFEAQGRAGTTSSALDWLLAGMLAGAQTAPVGVVLPPLREQGAPGRLDGGRCAVLGLGTVALSHGDTALVATSDGAGARLVSTGALQLRTVKGLDPLLGLLEVSGDVAVPGPALCGPSDWPAALAVGQLALAHELVGLSRAMLELAREHALGRMQFGRPISSFQAVRHRLAESLVAVESADALLAATWDELSPLTAAMAKGLAGRSARTVARHAQQVLAGIGFTTEHPLHGLVRRTIVLDQLLGAGSDLTRLVGASVLETGSLPAELPL